MSGTLAYDPLGRLRSYATGGVTTEFLYDGDRLVAEYVSNAVARRYAHGPGVDEPLIWYEGAATNANQNWLIADRQGSIIATTNASGAATTYAYDPYGIPREWTGPRFRYTGQAILPELQLYHYKARVYDPNLGRFLQTDPVGYQDDFNLYAYVRNDPLNRSDPTGRRPPDEDMIEAQRAGGYIPPNAQTDAQNRQYLNDHRPASEPSSAVVGVSGNINIAPHVGVGLAAGVVSNGNDTRGFVAVTPESNTSSGRGTPTIAGGLLVGGFNGDPIDAGGNAETRWAIR